MTDKIRLRDIAGYCPEEAIWKMLAELSRLLDDDIGKHSPNPDSILVVGDSFVVDTGVVAEEEFLAPEHHEGQAVTAEQAVWALGATAYYMATGHAMFGGYGGKYQHLHPRVTLPNMPKAFHALTPVFHKCVSSQPTERINLRELANLADKGFETCSRKQREAKKKEPFTETGTSHHDRWPEEMTEI